MKKQPFEKRPCVRAVCAEDRLVLNSSDVNLLLQHQKEIERNDGPRKVSPRSITDIPIQTASSFYKVKDVSEWQCWASCVVSLGGTHCRIHCFFLCPRQCCFCMPRKAHLDENTNTCVRIWSMGENWDYHPEKTCCLLDIDTDSMASALTKKRYTQMEHV
jgi:hypothetical protein